MAVRNMKTCVYLSDDGKEYLKRLDARYQAQNNGADPPVLLLGALVATSDQLNTLPNVPRDLKARHVILATADGAFKSKMECFTPTAYIALSPPQTVTFYDGQGTAHVGVIRGHEGEHSMHKTDIT
jgi:hypothetical protein